jgi:hypothetical protein
MDDAGKPLPMRTAYPGMTLRDWFAGLALPAIIARNSDAGEDGEAHDAYLYADAMLKAREIGDV